MAHRRRRQRDHVAETGSGPSVGDRLPALKMAGEKGKGMSEKEKELCAKIAEKVKDLPAEVKEKFLTMAEGAALAVEELREEEDDDAD